MSSKCPRRPPVGTTEFPWHSARAGSLANQGHGRMRKGGKRGRGRRYLWQRQTCGPSGGGPLDVSEGEHWPEGDEWGEEEEEEGDEEERKDSKKTQRTSTRNTKSNKRSALAPIPIKMNRVRPCVSSIPELISDQQQCHPWRSLMPRRADYRHRQHPGIFLRRPLCLPCTLTFSTAENDSVRSIT